MMRRTISVLTVGAMMAALMMLIAAPAMAQVFIVDDDDRDRDRVFFFDRDRDFFFDRGFGQDFDQEAESGDIDIEADITNTGDNSNVCAPVAQFGNTGNVQNSQGGTQFFSTADDFDFEGSELVFEPSLDTTCVQSVEQAAAASSSWWSWW